MCLRKESGKKWRLRKKQVKFSMRDFPPLVLLSVILSLIIIIITITKKKQQHKFIDVHSQHLPQILSNFAVPFDVKIIRNLIAGALSPHFNPARFHTFRNHCSRFSSIFTTFCCRDAYRTLFLAFSTIRMKIGPKTYLVPCSYNLQYDLPPTVLRTSSFFSFRLFRYSLTYGISGSEITPKDIAGILQSYTFDIYTFVVVKAVLF